METYRVVAVERQKTPYEAKMTFGQITDFVGYVTPLFLYDDKVALVDEDAKLLQVPLNRMVVIQEKSVIPQPILGNFVVIKQTKTEFVDLTDDEVKEALYVFRSTSLDSTIFI